MVMPGTCIKWKRFYTFIDLNNLVGLGANETVRTFHATEWFINRIFHCWLYFRRSKIPIVELFLFKVWMTIYIQITCTATICKCIVQLWYWYSSNGVLIFFFRRNELAWILPQNIRICGRAKRRTKPFLQLKRYSQKVTTRYRITEYLTYSFIYLCA